jgi:hypothetical protein
MFARMTTIAQKAAAGNPGNIFDDGAIFGPITWSNGVLAKAESGVIKASTWRTGGTQSWPSDPSRIQVIPGSNGLAGETDIIDLYP